MWEIIWFEIKKKNKVFIEVGLENLFFEWEVQRKLDFGLELGLGDGKLRFKIKVPESFLSAWNRI